MGKCLGKQRRCAQMASINKLTAKQVVGLPQGLHSDGGNLYLVVRPGGSRQWSCAIASAASNVKWV